MRDIKVLFKEFASAPRVGRASGSRRGRSRLWPAMIAIAAIILLWPVWAGFYTNWLWFDDLGYLTVFSTILGAKVALGAVVGLIAAAVAWLNFRLALRLSHEPPPVEVDEAFDGRGIQAPNLSGMAKRLALPASLGVGAFAGLLASNAWDVFLRFRHGEQFGESDPVFGRDMAFYFYTLPALEAVSQLLMTLLLASLIGAGLIYFAREMSVGEGRVNFTLSRGPRAHLLVIIGALFLLLAGQAWLAVPNLLYSTRGPVAGASYTDLNAVLPLLYAKIAVAAFVALLAFASIRMAKIRLLVIGAAVYLLTTFAGLLYPGVVQRFSVAPNELAKETPYIEHNVAATRKAFGLDRVEERELTGEVALTEQDIRENQRTVKNIRLWDQQPLLDTFAQLQEIRPYYEFRSVDNDRYRINGELQQVMLSARELSAASLPNRNWINERLTFTHGYGVTLGPVDQVTAEGLPLLNVKDIPPASSVPSLDIERPEIYFGELSNDRVYVNTRAKEFNYPAGEENIFRNYTGETGVGIGSAWRQLLFATRFADLKLLLSDDLTPESRVLFHRDIRERLGLVAPFLRFDGDPYLVVSEGRLFWIADAYTVSDHYPYSQPVGGINYIRNSVKAVVDAYHGHVRLYIADESDSLIRTWARIFPGVLKPLAEMPEGLRAHLRYPEDIFKIQTQVYSTYHMDNPQVFYNKEDQWAVAAMNEAQDGGKSQAMEPYYTVMKLPGGQSEEFILMLPFTPKGKDNLASWMAARADGENYGKLVVYRFPKQRLVYGPKQVAARINQDPEISRQLSLWNQRGSRVILGTLMVIPIKESLVYVQPLYLRAETGRIPELRRVIVSAENRIAMEPTLEASLARIFGGAPETPETLAQSPQSPPLATGGGGLASQARRHYERALQAQREGDWARYGEEIKRLGAALGQMSTQE